MSAAALPGDVLPARHIITFSSITYACSLYLVGFA